MKRNLIFLHGGPGFNDYLRPYFEDLTDSFNCHFYNQRKGVNVQIDDLIAELDAKIVIAKNPVLIGHSWGGILAIEYLRRKKNAVTGLVLMSTLISSVQWVEYRKDLEDMGLCEATWDQLFFAPLDPGSEREQLTNNIANFSEETFSSLFKTYLGSFDLTTTLRDLSIPILNVFGDMDLRCPVRIPRSFRNFQPKIQDLEISGAGHFPFLQMESRAKIQESLRAFFASF